MNKVSKLDYQGFVITLEEVDNSMMVNATEMAKPFGKRPTNFMVLKSTNDFIMALSSDTGIPVTQLTYSVRGNSTDYTQGTWMHKDLAMEFARWLSPEFAVWCNKQIETLLTKGRVSIKDDYLNMIRDPDFIETLLIEFKESRKKVSELEEKVEKDKPKVEVYNKLISSSDLLSLSETAKVIGVKNLGRNKMIKLLKDRGVFCTSGRDTVPHQRYIDVGYFKVKERVWTDYLGHDKIDRTTLVTQKGLIWLQKGLNSYLSKELEYAK